MASKRCPKQKYLATTSRKPSPYRAPQPLSNQCPTCSSATAAGTQAFTHSGEIGVEAQETAPPQPPQPPRETVLKDPESTTIHGSTGPAVDSNRSRPKIPLNTLENNIHNSKDTQHRPPIHPTSTRAHLLVKGRHRTNKDAAVPCPMHHHHHPHPDRSKPHQPTPHSLTDAADDACCGMVSKTKRKATTKRRNHSSAPPPPFPTQPT